MPDGEAMAEEQQAGGSFGTLVLAAGTDIPDDYSQQWYVRCHAYSYPQGTGGRPAGMSSDSWQRREMRSFPASRIQERGHVILTMQEVTQRHAVLTQTCVQLRLSPALVEKVQTMSPTDYDATLALLRSGSTGKKLGDQLRAASPAVRALYQAYKTCSRHVVGSPSSHASLRSRAIGLWSLFGPFTTFITFNPSELHAQLASELCGRPYTFEQNGTPGPDRPASQVERWQVVARNPIACATFLDVVVQAFLAELLCWRRGAPCQTRATGPFGRVLAYFLNLETSGRGGTPHVHGNLIQPALQPAVFFSNLQWQRHAAQYFVESFAHAWLPAPYASLPTVRARFGVAEQQVLSLPASDEPGLVAACQPRLNKGQEVARRDVAAAVLAVNVHTHTDTCSKYGGAPDDEHCRMQYSRPLRAPTLIDPQRQLCIFERDGEQLIPYTPALMAMLPCNQATYFLGDRGRQDRLAEFARRKGLPAPALKPVEQEQMDGAWYSCKYSTKPWDRDGINTSVLEAALESSKRQSTEDRGDASARCPTGDARAQARRRIAHAVNVVTGGLNTPGPLAALYMQLGQDHYISHQTEPFAAHAFLETQPRVAAETVLPDVCLPYERVAGPGLAAPQYVSRVEDYLCRAKELEDYPPYVLAMYYRKEPQDACFKTKESSSTVSQKKKKRRGYPLSRVELL